MYPLMAFLFQPQYQYAQLLRGSTCLMLSDASCQLERNSDGLQSPRVEDEWLLCGGHEGGRETGG